MKRADALRAIKTCAAQNDMKGATRIYTEHRISYAAYQQAVESGRKFGAWIASRDAELNAQAARS